MPWMALFQGVRKMTTHEVEAERVSDHVLASLRSGGKVTVIALSVSSERDLTITEPRKLIKARADSARGAA